MIILRLLTPLLIKLVFECKSSLVNSYSETGTVLLEPNKLTVSLINMSCRSVSCVVYPTTCVLG